MSPRNNGSKSIPRQMCYHVTGIIDLVKKPYIVLTRIIRQIMDALEGHQYNERCMNAQ